MDVLAPRLRPPLSVPRRLLRLRSDAVLAQRFAAGDEVAFAVLYERHRASVLAVCMGVLGSRQDAEDASQESFAALALALRGEPPRDLRAWLARVSRNAAIDLARRRRPVKSAGDDLPAGAASFNGPDELESVLQGIRELPESQRTALLLPELAGHTYREIASLLETEEHAVRGLIARARVGLRDHREASELPCAAAREAIAAEPDGRPRDRTVRRHVRGCGVCQAYMRALRDDAKVLRGLGAKGALLSGALTQVTAACAVSVCAVGGVVLVAPHEPVRHRVRPASAAGPLVTRARTSSRTASAAAVVRAASGAPALASAAASARAAVRSLAEPIPAGSHTSASWPISTDSGRSSSRSAGRGSGAGAAAPAGSRRAQPPQQPAGTNGARTSGDGGVSRT